MKSSRALLEAKCFVVVTQLLLNCSYLVGVVQPSVYARHGLQEITNLAKLTQAERSQETGPVFVAIRLNCAWLPLLYCVELILQMCHRVLALSGPFFFKRKARNLV